MTSTKTPQSERKHAYHTVIETVRHQTGPTQGWHIPKRHIRVTCCANGSLPPERYESALHAAIDNGDLLTWHGQLVRCTPETLHAAVREEAESQHPRRGFIAALNRAIDGLEGGDQA